MDRLTPIAEDTLREYRDLARDARDSVPDLRRTNEEIRGLTRDLRQTVPDLRRTNDDVAATARTWNRLGERLDVLVQANQEKVVKAIDNLNESLTRVNNLLNEENQRNVNRTLRNLGAASDRFDSIARNADDITKEGRTTVRRLNDTLVRADATLADVQKITQPLGERGTALARNLDEGLANLNRTLTDVDALVRAIGNSNGTVSRLLTDPTLYNRLDEALCAVQKSLPRLDRILANFEVFSDKLARHPELLGVRGAVRPDSGLK
jgi:phospholipid/cholesterol/gamma-HCH transport system substrate-binding protein